MMDIKRITEVGVAVKDLEKATKLFVDLLGAEAGPVIDMPMYGMKYRMCRVGKVDFELMAPAGDDGVIAKYLESKGEGLHHVAFAVKDLAEGMRSLESKGVQFVSEEPLSGHGQSVDYAGREVAGHTKFTFSVPSSILGILFEFIEYPEGYETP
ncbi:MAG: VOC family protein [Deltaproteobacteria bacterium]|nr:VOC family protein [Deltaproteobacteria bacterium]